MATRLIIFIAAILSGCWASTAHAVDVSAEVSFVTDYRYRGISLSDELPAAQTSVTLEHDSGLYANIWGSTIKEPETAMHTEIDLTGGDVIALPGSLSLDLSGTYYVYPEDRSANYFETTAMIVAEHGRGAATLGISFVPKQKATRDDGHEGREDVYLFARSEYAVPKTSVGLSAQLGYEHGCFDEADRGGKLDWSLGAELSIDQASFGMSFIGYKTSDRDANALIASFTVEM